MLRLLRRLLNVPGTDDLKAIYTRLEAVERSEWERSQQHAVMIDQLDRVYKRFAARIAREHVEPLPETGSARGGAPEAESQAHSGESVLAMRRRLRGG